MNRRHGDFQSEKYGKRHIMGIASSWGNPLTVKDLRGQVLIRGTLLNIVVLCGRGHNLGTNK